LNTWYYVAGVYDATARTLSTYVNGVLNNGTLSGTVPSSQVNLGVNVNIGRRARVSYGGFYFNGIIDEVRVYSRALSQLEIQNDMNTPLSAPAAQLGPAIVGVQAVARGTTVKVAWSEKAGTVSNVSSAPAMDGGAIAAQGSAPRMESTIDLNVSAVENGTSSYQWQQDGVDIPGATGRAYTVRLGNPSSPVTRIRCIAWNQSGADTSSDAVISHQAVPGTDVISDVQKPLTYSLEQNYPNPFNPATTIRYATPKAGYVKLEVYNLMGQKVATLVGGEQEAGYHDVRFDASNLASGLYFYRLQSGDFNQTRKLQLIK
jgi:flagellar hook assembly protein FlgD